MPPSIERRSPTTALLMGLFVTLAMVVLYSWYVSGEVVRLRQLQEELTDRGRRNSLQLLRVENNLNQLAHAMRDMLEVDGPYPLAAWSTQFARIREDLDEALAREAEASVVRRTPEQGRYLATSVSQFWDAADRVFGLARAGHEAEARAQIRVSLQARQEALTTTVARLLVENNAADEQTARQVQEIYRNVQLRAYTFLAATLALIVATTLYLIRSNRRMFARLAALSDERKVLAQTLIATRESTLREISRELHDEFGQILTAVGSMLGRARRQVPESSPLHADLREIGTTAQAALEKVRALSQSLHPSILEELGLESTIEWYVSTVERQLGISIAYEREGEAVAIDDATAIHVYRVLQEAVNNLARHSGTTTARVRLRFAGDTLELEVEDNGKGIAPGQRPRGLGLVAMRERVELVRGTIEFLQPRDGGTLLRVSVPLSAGAGA